MAKIKPRTGKTVGPDHTEGGINAQKGKKPIAEVEGDERLFSKEDSSYMDEQCQNILMATESGDKPTADQLAMELGYKVCEMIQRQDARNEEQRPADYVESASNEFGNGEDY